MMTYQGRVQDWTQLTDGSAVLICERGGAGYPGTIDTKTSDSTVVWVLDSNGQRRAVDYRGGVVLSVLPASAPTR